MLMNPSETPSTCGEASLPHTDSVVSAEGLPCVTPPILTSPPSLHLPVHLKLSELLSGSHEASLIASRSTV